MRKDANTEFKRKNLNKEIVVITKTLSLMRNAKIDRHSRLHMDVSQLCDRRNEEIDRKVDLARRRVKEEKRQKAKARASKPKVNKDRRLQTVADAPIDSSTPLQ